MTVVPRFTPGRFTALWVVLRSVSKLGGTVGREEVLAFARRDGLRSGGLPVKDGYHLAVVGGFVCDEEKVSLTDLGKEAVRRSVEEEPPEDVLRLFASVLLLRHPPAWVAYWQGDPSSLELVLPEPARQILQEARLLDRAGSDLEAWALWDALREVPPFEILAEQRKAIGDAAEELSVDYEKRRLAREGYPGLAQGVRWVAKESAAYGFDILSFCGSSRFPASPERRLAIEVKGQTVTSQGQFTFFLSSHEWRTALALGDQYAFHLWDGIRSGNIQSQTRSEPFLVLPEVLREHVPSAPACGVSCEWKSAMIVLRVQPDLEKKHSSSLGEAL